MGITVFLPAKDVEQFKAEAQRARDRARAAFTEWERRREELRGDKMKREHPPAELLNLTLEAQRTAVATITEAAGDLSAAKKRAAALARALNMESLLGSARYTQTVTGTAGEQAMWLLAERETRTQRREQIAAMRSADDICAALDDAVERALRDGPEHSGGLADVHEITRRIREKPIPGAPNLMSAAIKATTTLGDRWGERGLLLAELEEASGAYDDVAELAASARTGQRTTRTAMNVFTGRAA